MLRGNSFGSQYAQNTNNCTKSISANFWLTITSWQIVHYMSKRCTNLQFGSLLPWLVALPKLLRKCPVCVCWLGGVQYVRMSSWDWGSMALCLTLTDFNSGGSQPWWANWRDSRRRIAAIRITRVCWRSNQTSCKTQNLVPTNPAPSNTEILPSVQKMLHALCCVA